MLLPFGLLTQVRRPTPPKKEIKDSIQLSCVLNNAVDAPEEESTYVMPEKELMLAIKSSSDTTVKACIDGVISKVQRDEDGRWEIVFYHNDYWFWITGVSRLIVKAQQKIKSGDALGYAPTGTRIELRMYDFETPVDPKIYIRCGQ